MIIFLPPIKKQQQSAFQPNQEPNVEFLESQLQLEKNEMTCKKYSYIIKETQQMPMCKYLRKPWEDSLTHIKKNN